MAVSTKVNVLLLALLVGAASAGRSAKAEVKTHISIKEEDMLQSFSDFQFHEDEENTCAVNTQTYASKSDQRSAFDSVRSQLGLKDTTAVDTCSKEKGYGKSCKSSSDDQELEKCTTRDVCLLMMELDSRHVRKNVALSKKSHEVALPEWSPEQIWYYSTYKLKASMKSGGTVANSASCSFGAQAHLFRKHWTTSSCARLMTYNGQNTSLQEYRKIYMDKMSNEWCPAIWEEAISSGSACDVPARNGDAKWALTVEACSKITEKKLTEYELCGEKCREPKWYGVGGTEITSCFELTNACSSPSKDKEALCKEMEQQAKNGGGLSESQCKMWLKDLERN